MSQKLSEVVIPPEPLYTPAPTRWMSKRLITAILAPMILFGYYNHVGTRKSVVSAARSIVWAADFMGDEEDPAKVLRDKLAKEKQDLEQRYRSGEVPALDAARKAAEAQAATNRKLDAILQQNQIQAEKVRSLLDEARAAKRNVGMALVAARLVPDLSGAFQRLGTVLTGLTEKLPFWRSQAVAQTAAKRPVLTQARHINTPPPPRHRSRPTNAEMLQQIDNSINQELNGIINQYNRETEMRVRDTWQGRMR